MIELGKFRGKKFYYIPFNDLYRIQAKEYNKQV